MVCLVGQLPLPSLVTLLVKTSLSENIRYKDKVEINSQYTGSAFSDIGTCKILEGDQLTSHEPVS